MSALPPCNHECLGDRRKHTCGATVGAFGCTRDPGHRGPCVACSDGKHATVVWNVIRPTIAVGEAVMLPGVVHGWGVQWQVCRVVELRGDRAKVVNVTGTKVRPRWFSQVRLRYAPLYLGTLPDVAA